MAGDTRDTNSPPQTRGATSVGTAPPPHVGTPSRYEVFQGPPESANALPEGSGQNTAGSTPPVPKLSDAIKTLRIEDIKQVHMYPCVRESLLYGIGGGFGVGGVRALWGGK
jgi:cytochrome c oxidase assembly protein subunit 20